MSHHRSKKPSYQLKAVTAIGVAAITAAGVVTPSAASAASSGPSGTLKIITWVNPPAVAAITKIDQLFEQKYPNVKVQLQTAANVTAGYATLLSTTVSANTADIVTNVYQIAAPPAAPNPHHNVTNSILGLERCVPALEQRALDPQLYEFGSRHGDVQGANIRGAFRRIPTGGVL